MKLETHLTQTLKQTQKLSMKQQLSLKALSMNAQELVEMIQEEANTNPLLEIDEFSADSNTGLIMIWQLKCRKPVPH